MPSCGVLIMSKSSDYHYDQSITCNTLLKHLTVVTPSLNAGSQFNVVLALTQHNATQHNTTQHGVPNGMCSVGLATLNRTVGTVNEEDLTPR
jgi:hypothetical protein